MARGPALTTLQITLRALQLTVSVILLALYSYTLGALANRSLPTPTDVRAVEGIVGITLAYTIACVVVLKCFPVRTFPAFVFIVLDVIFAATYIYVAVANKGGAGSCSGEVTTHFGKGDAGDKPESKGGFMALPTYGDACRLLSAGLALSIFMIFLFIASTAITFRLGRNHHREKRQALLTEEPTSYPPPPASLRPDPKPPATAPSGFSLKNLFRRRQHAPLPDYENALPEHPSPEQLPPSHNEVVHDDYVRVDASAARYSHPMTQIHHGTTSEFDIGTATDLGDRRRRDSFEGIPLHGESYGPPHTSTNLSEVSPATHHPHRPSAYSDEYADAQTQYISARPSPPSNITYHSEPLYANYHPHHSQPMRPTASTVGQTPSSSAQLGEVDMGDQHSQVYFPEGPYENLRPASQRSGIPGRNPRPVRPSHRYDDGVYDV